jgi:poly-beta-1,6-N-acetyl-D-glucosamine synthase
VKVHCSIGIMAYNEVNNIGRVLDALIHQATDVVVIDSISVVCSGCTDNTEGVVEGFVKQNPQIHLLIQPKRMGKASAVNLFLRSATSEVVVLESADTLPRFNAIESLVSPFTDPKVGMVGGHPVPTNSRESLMGFGVHLLWELHHRISLIRPKMGELIAFRQIFHQIPNETAVDEASIEPLIIGQGFKCAYAPEAVVYNCGPETIRDFIKQRRRIYSGHLYVKETIGYEVSTMNGFRIIGLLFQIPRQKLRDIFRIPFIIFLEVFVRTLGAYDYYWRKRNPFKWPMVESTKKRIDCPDPTVDAPPPKSS